MLAMTEFTRQFIANLVDQRISDSCKSVVQVAKECGFHRPNVLSMIRNGQTNVPLAKVEMLALSLEMNPRVFLEQVFRAYHPEVWDVIESALLSGRYQKDTARCRI